MEMTTSTPISLRVRMEMQTARFSTTAELWKAWKTVCTLLSQKHPPSGHIAARIKGA
jgi:hypothetical protein